MEESSAYAKNNQANQDYSTAMYCISGGGGSPPKKNYLCRYKDIDLSFKDKLNFINFDTTIKPKINFEAFETKFKLTKINFEPNFFINHLQTELKKELDNSKIQSEIRQTFHEERMAEISFFPLTRLTQQLTQQLTQTHNFLISINDDGLEDTFMASLLREDGEEDL